jgi:single-stranded-DNA-specific exonuclease
MNNKKLNKETIKKILSQRFLEGEKKLSQIPNPSLLKDGVKTAKRIALAIQNKQRITVVGDYDVDGIVSTAIMVEFFRLINYPLDAIIPNRFKDGYGVSPTLLERIEADVIITVDNGITALEAAKICKERGIDLLITDHHTPQEQLPDAYSIVDPKQTTCNYPFKEICGAEVAWLVLALLKQELGADINMRSFVDMLCIAIIADIMPLVDINRTLVKDGLKALQSSQRASSVIIRDFLNKSTITAEDIAFMIAPRINSAGRLEDASISLEFLTAPSTQKAYMQFEKLNSLNEYRKELEAQTTNEAISLVDESQSVIVVAKEGWHEGVVGIVASRLVERFKKPAVVLSINGDVAKGSARSLAEVDLFSLICSQEQYLLKFGGHKMAAGLSLKKENIPLFKEELNKVASQIPKEDFIPKDDVMGILDASCIDYELLDILESFEPFGEANTRPKFLAQNAKVVAVKTFGSDNSHSKIVLELEEGVQKEFIVFRQVLDKALKSFTCSYTVTKNEFNNRTSIQLLVNQIYN